jgi:hypothetical protein
MASLLTVTPAFARPDPGEPFPSAGSRPDGAIVQYPAPAAGADSRNHRGAGATTEENRVSREQMAPKTPAVVTLDDDAVEYLQIGLGALGGVALMAAGAAAVSASHRRHAHAHPA